MNIFAFDESVFLKNKLNKGLYYNLVNNVHVNSLGDEAAKFIYRNAEDIFIESQNIYAETLKNNNVLLVGKVQSGKTANLLMLSALAFDNDYNLLVFYGGYDNGLLNQTKSRFIKTFGIDVHDPKDTDPIIYTTLPEDKESIEDLDEQLLGDFLLSNRKLIFISLKRPPALKIVNIALKKIRSICENKGINLNSFIIDDEGDQAGLNTKKNKEYDFSPTYAQIVEMKNILKEPLYFSVTATPHANIFLDDYSKLRPDTIKLIKPSKGYTGADAYHIYNNKVICVSDFEIEEKISNNNLPSDLKLAINYYLLASSLLIKKNIKKTDMIIHISRSIQTHSEIYKVVNRYINNFRLLFEQKSPNLEIFIRSIENLYTTEYFDESILTESKFNELIPMIEQVLRNVTVIIKNGVVTNSTYNDQHRRYKIYIGGDLLQRGLTFDKLITTFFTRWAKEGNMDTTLQRARWLGYRLSYYDYCKVFTTSDISEELTILADSELDLWEQLDQVENNELQIKDIIIFAANSSLKPTSRSRVDYSKINYNKKWNSQREGLFDINYIEYNNNLVNNLLNKYKFYHSTVGRLDAQVYAEYAYINKEDIIDLINKTYYIFDSGAPFNKSSLINSFGKEDIILIKMPDRDGRVRQRNFNPENFIDALQQGADTVEISKRKFLGDRHVIIDRNAINIQLFKIHPKVNGVLKDESYIQYMVSFYFPKNINAFKRG